MGTRNLTAVFMDGEYKVAQYGQWDGYPSGQGVDILNILKNAKKDILKNQLKKVRFIDPEKDKKFIDEYDAKAPKYIGDPETRTQDQIHWFESYASRDLGGKILSSIINSTDDEMVLKNSINFAGDSLFCEFAYVVDFDKNTFEIYQGFNKEKIDKSERFASFKCDGDEYKQVKFVHSFDLECLPDKKEFLEILEPEEEDED
ncbi:MAG: hypothetical protein HON48_09620 [Desulfobacula sp.]|jgi:hypothetical protein|nr:hypothetical protein [Desulfobacula sp.]